MRQSIGPVLASTAGLAPTRGEAAAVAVAQLLARLPLKFFTGRAPLMRRVAE